AGGAGAQRDRANAGGGGAPVPALGAGRLLFGGGGGGAAGDDPIPTPRAAAGQSGGGLVWLRAESVVVASSGAIRANGAGGAVSKAEGAGGGGAGGTILLDADVPAALLLEAKGGDGNRSRARKDGGGGGGGGGAVYLASAGAVSPVVSGGRGGASKTSHAIFRGLDGAPGRLDVDVDIAAALACPLDPADDEDDLPVGDTAWVIDTGWGDADYPGAVDSGGPGDSGIAADDPAQCTDDTMPLGTLRATTSPWRTDFVPSCSEQGQYDSAFGGPDHQVAFTAPRTGTYVFDTVGSHFDTVLSLHTSCEDRTELACNDEGFTREGASRVELAMTAGQTILVNVDGFDDFHFGKFQLNISPLRATEQSCRQGRDLDGDGLEGCLDPDCAGLAECVEDCTDDEDNDLDGLQDCFDPDCHGVAACVEDCADGIDNDRDGDVDCADSACATDVACPEDCTDRIDNDGDGGIDCRDTACTDDPSCLALACPATTVPDLPARLVLDTVGMPDHHEPTTCSFEADLLAREIIQSRTYIIDPAVTPIFAILDNSV
ncbi:MAG: hypothetical protein AAF602_32280, partial [Myxococcota bacterium]